MCLRVSSSTRTEILEAMEPPANNGKLINQSDCRTTWPRTKVESSTASVGDSYDNGLAETRWSRKTRRPEADYAGLAKLVQLTTAAGTHREYSASRGRRAYRQLTKPAEQHHSQQRACEFSRNSAAAVAALAVLPPPVGRTLTCSFFAGAFDCLLNNRGIGR